MKFNNSEEQVVAGSQSGSLRVWDLEAAKSETAFLLYIVCMGRLGMWDVEMFLLESTRPKLPVLRMP